MKDNRTLSKLERELEREREQHEREERNAAFLLRLSLYEIDERTKARYAIPEQATTTAGFAAYMQRAIIEELERQRAKLRERKAKEKEHDERDMDLT
jgi:hypothetical protein